MLEEMIEEVRQEFQIPPYFPDESLLRLFRKKENTVLIRSIREETWKRMIRFGVC